MLPEVPLLKILSKLDTDDLVSMSQVSKSWNLRIGQIRLKNSSFWSDRIAKSTGEFWSSGKDQETFRERMRDDRSVGISYSQVWRDLVKNIPLNLKDFLLGRKLFEGIRDKTGEYDECARRYYPDWNRGSVAGIHCLYTKQTETSFKSTNYRFYLAKISKDATNGLVHPSAIRGSFDALAKYLKDFGDKKPFNFFKTEKFLITWPGSISGNINHISKQDFGVRIISNDSEMDDQIQFIRAPSDYDITHSTIDCSVSDSGRFLYIMFQNTAHFTKRRKLQVYALPTKKYKFYKEVSVLDRKQAVRVDKEDRIELQWRDDMLLIQTAFTRLSYLFDFRMVQTSHKSDEPDYKSRLLIEDDSARIYELIRFKGHIIVLYDEDKQTGGKVGVLGSFKTPTDSTKDFKGPYFYLKNRKKKNRNAKLVNVLWKDTASRFFLPFKIEYNHFIFAKFRKKTPEEREIEGDANDNREAEDEENHVKSISLHKLFERQIDDEMPILEFCPSKIRNDSFNLDNQPRLTHMNNTIRHVQNRVTAMKPCYVNWLKTGTWDYYAPARRKLVRETSVLKRKRTDDEIIEDFKRRKAGRSEEKVDPSKYNNVTRSQIARVKANFDALKANMRRRIDRNND